VNILLILQHKARLIDENSNLLPSRTPLDAQSVPPNQDHDILKNTILMRMFPRDNLPMKRWKLILTIAIIFLAGCSPEPPPALTPTSTFTPQGLSQQLNQFATQTQAAVQTTTAEAQQAPQEPLPVHTPLSATPIPLSPQAIGPFQQFSPQEALTAGNVLDLQVGENGIVVVSENGISGFEDGEWLGYFTAEIGYPIGIDVTGRAWVVDPHGTAIYRSEPYVWRVAQYDDTIVWENFNWVLISSQSGKPVKFDLLTDRRGDLWVATVKDVRSFNSSWMVHDSLAMGMPQPAGDTSAEYVILPVQNTGEVLVGRCDWGTAGPQGGGGVRSFDGQTWHELADELNTGCATAMTENATGDVWLALDNRLYHQVNGTWEQISLPEAPPQNRFGYYTGLTADPVDGLWVQLALCEPEGCFGGEMLYRLSNGEWQPIGEPSPAGGRRVLFDSSGAPWLLAGGEISQIVDSTPQPVSELAVLAATNDDSGNLWLLAQSNGPPTIWSER